ncbi:MAG: XRE family transcriptional regulator, partial [Blastochloris sp.]|nr:XRE family transcriptional regulator [Blastochloris sp.]
MDAAESFGVWLREARRARDLSREALAERASCAVPTLAKIEQGSRRPSRELASLLLDVLQTDPGQREHVLWLARLPRAGSNRQPEPSNYGEAPTALSALPTAPGPLIGRAAELQMLREQLVAPSCRTITLVGPGGVGKTRLALEVATEPGSRFADGVAWVALADVSGAEGVGPAIAEATGCPLRGDSPLDTRLIAYLRERRLLLVLDNLEHLLAATPLLDAVVRHAPGVTLLSSSRERLGLAGERVIELDGLGVPSPQAEPSLEQYDATLLFITRAHQAGGALTANSTNRQAIAQICRLLEGVPLAIELAATWTRILSCVELAAELAHGLALLATTAAHVPLRHRSMHAVFGHSWGLLADDERRALAALSIFTGGFTRTAAERVAHVSLGVLAKLVEKSLLRRQERAGQSRYRLHELVRQYAAERLAPGEAPALGARHSAFYAELLAASLPELQAGPQTQALARLEDERANIRQAWAWGSRAGRRGADAALR